MARTKQTARRSQPTRYILARIGDNTVPECDNYSVVSGMSQEQHRTCVAGQACVVSGFQGQHLQDGDSQLKTYPSSSLGNVDQPGWMPQIVVQSLPVRFSQLNNQSTSSYYQ